MSTNFRIFISKRMKTAQNNVMTVMSWNKSNNILACGYKNGDIILHTVNESKSQPGTLQLNTSQSLLFHKQPITAIEWNDNGKSIFSGDESGKIAFWHCPHKMWKNKLSVNSINSPVTCIKWNKRKKLLAVAFSDKTVVYALDDGSIKWSNQMRQPIEFIEFSNKGKNLLLGTAFGEVLIVNEQGVETGLVPLPCLQGSNDEPKIVALENHPRAEYGILIAYKSGIIQLMRSDNDSQPITIHFDKELSSVKWFNSGEMFTACTTNESDKCGVVFSSATGIRIRELDVQGSSITNVALNSNDTQVALCLGDTFCLAQIIPTFLNAFTRNTLVYAFNNYEGNTFTVIYYNYILDEKRVHNVDGVLNLSGDNGYFAVFSKINENLAKVQITDTIGVFVASADIPFIPKYFSISEKTVVAANDNKIGVWRFEDEKMPIFKDFLESNIYAIHLFKTSLLISIENFIILFDAFSLNEIRRHKVGILAEDIKCSCDMKRLTLIDHTGLLQFFNTDSSRTIGSARKEVWNPMYSTKIPSLFAASEKQKMSIFNNMIVEDSFQTLSNIIEFTDLELLTVDLMKLMQDPLQPSKKYFKSYPTKVFKNFKKRLADRPSVTIESTLDYIKQEKIPRLYDELAQTMMLENNLPMAEKCYLQNLNYQGLQFIKRVRAVRDPKLQRAQILQYFGRFDDAQNIYESIDRTDLSVEMRFTIGDFQGIINILGSSSSDETVGKAFENLGDSYVEEHNWIMAAKSYSKSKNKAKYALALFMTNDYAGLSKLLKKQSSRSTLLPIIGRMFLALGAADEAANAFMTCGDTEAALEACARLGNWKTALELGGKKKESEIRAKMSLYASELIEGGQISTAIDFYAQAGLFIDAAKLLERRGDELFKQSFTKLVEAKKCYIFAGLKLTESEDFETESSLLDGIWKKAEAIHFYLLAHRCMQKKKWKNALLCAARVFEIYYDIIGEDKAAALLAVCGIKTGFYQQCSKAFTTLENFDDYSQERRQLFENLAIDIFTKRPPVDPKGLEYETCPKCSCKNIEINSQCNECGFKFPICVATGFLIANDDRWQCKFCRHCVSMKSSEDLIVCPFCHQTITA
ncbi:WD repeat protein [Tritrichomonas foetus]|uniref:WD repeat protein n=1 Tax=Tritrichomonas foetus TaxID=1144522 RepID=A0A1J4J7X8_9EUKA|nr:WD repeat protein [Tritrichomonas foetus]|eukprot:OHS94343.1 WD repeat protein [Tritrichomonas foetus]